MDHIDRKRQLLTEQAYIDVRDLSNILNCNAILRDITIENQRSINKSEYQDVLAKLSKWKDALFTKITNIRNETDDMIEE